MAKASKKTSKRGRPAAPAVDPNAAKESKEDRFSRLAGKRMVNAIGKIRNVGRLSNTATYAYTEEQAAKIIGTLYAEVQAVEQAFSRAPKQKEAVTFEV